MISRFKSDRFALGAIGILAGLSTLAPAAHADLLFSIQSVTANPGDVNDAFEVDVTNTGPSAVDLAGYSFQITTSSTDITFQQSTDATVSNPYVFAGNSLFGPVTSITSPGQSLLASDVGSIPGSGTTIGAGATLGLSEVFFDVAPTALAEVLAIDFNTSIAFSSAADPNGDAIPLEFSDGTVTIGGTAPAPEPSSAVLLLTALAAIGSRRRRNG